MRIATWNVNSIKMRLGNVLDWIKSCQPDVLMLQEIKCETSAFPVLEFNATGYKVQVLGQKAYNGVAIVSRYKIEEPLEHLPEAGNDTQARYLEASVNGIRLASIYLPNGNPAGTEKFDYKLAWLKRLRIHAKTLLQNEMPVVLGGDFNVIPEAIDVYDPKGWENDALFHPESRAAFRDVVHCGYTEAFRALHPQKKHAYTFWDYQAGAWDRDAGLRIDHFLLSPEAVDRMTYCGIDRAERGKDKSSDHTPLVLEIRD